MGVKINKIKNEGFIPTERIESKILLIRGKKVMLDRDLAELYGVKTEYLKRQVRRNIQRFPEDFLIILNKDEFDNLICQFGRSSWGGARQLPFTFTEHGILMLSSVLRSQRAVAVNIQIMRTFTKLREIMVSYKDLAGKIEAIEKKISSHDRSIILIFKTIKELLQPSIDPQVKKLPIGFHVK